MLRVARRFATEYTRAGAKRAGTRSYTPDSTKPQTTGTHRFIVLSPFLESAHANSCALATDYAQLLENNKIWAAAKVAEDPDYFKRLALIQKPTVCSNNSIYMHQLPRLRGEHLLEFSN
jgi:hypothetical protein